MSVSITTADHLSCAQLLDVWNRGFSGYFVDNTMDEARLDKHLRWSGVDLARSAVLMVDRARAAFSLAAVEDRPGGPVAWIAGFGVFPEHRRKGLAGHLIREHCEILDEAGIRETRLEVIDENPARRVYSAAGFREIGALHSFHGTARAEPISCDTMDVANFAAVHARLNATVRPVWRRDLPVLQRMLQDIPTARLLVVPGAAGHAAYALVAPGPERAGLIDAGAADADSARQLVAGLAAAWPGLPLRIIDEREGSEVAAALVGAGLSKLLTQFEMSRPGSNV